MELKQDLVQEIEPRLRKLSWVLLFLAGSILARLYYLQIIRGTFYRVFSEENSIRELELPALRGQMLDRHGTVLADNRGAFDLVLIPQYVLDPKKVLQTLHRYLDIPEDFLAERWEKRKTLPPFTPIPILEDVDAGILGWIKVHKNPWGKLEEAIDLRGVDIRLRYERAYEDGDMASHVLGYLREIDAKRLADYQQKWPGRYRRGDGVGIRGLEEIWDLSLRGEDGFHQKVINAVGREILASGLEGELIQKEAIGGSHLQLTLDARLQKKARDYFQDKRGAAVALDPKDGAVLLLYSAPSFDLNRLVGGESGKYWQEITTSPKKHLFNRAIQGSYPPGSVYKIVTGTAALQEKKVRPDQTFYCGGGLTFGNRRYKCWKDGGHGIISFQGGLIASCDVYFYNLGLKAGVDGIAKYARGFGLGERTGIGLSGEQAGLIPTSAWKEKIYGVPWQEGETLSIAIGQGADAITPLQAAVLIARVANGGKSIRPYLVSSILNFASGKAKLVEPPKPETPENAAALSPEVLAKVRKALIGVVHDPSGTAHRLHALGIPMGGKTGTAQVVSLGKECRGESCRDHAWFVAFAPAEDPKIAVSVLVEHGGHGSSGAAPLAGELIQTYLGRQSSVVSDQ